MARGRGLIREAREAAGYPVDRLHEEEIQRGRAFIPTVGGVNNIRVSYKIKEPPLRRLESRAEERLSIIVLFWNYTYEKDQRGIIVTDTSRTFEEQAKIIYNDVIIKHQGNYSQSMYQLFSGKKTAEMHKNGKSKKEIITFLTKHIENSTSGFNHVYYPGRTADIGINSNPWAKENDFKEGVLRVIGNQGKYLSSASLLWKDINKDGKENGETDCHHLVLLTI